MTAAVKQSMRLRRVNTIRPDGSSLIGMPESAIANGRARAATAMRVRTRSAASRPKSRSRNRARYGCKTTTAMQSKTTTPRTMLRGLLATVLALIT